MQGEARELARGGQAVFIFGLASLLLYMILASQFNSFAQPAIIMLAEPLAVVGGLLLLWLSGHTLNVYSMIGLILLIGLVAKNSILLVTSPNSFGQPVMLSMMPCGPVAPAAAPGADDFADGDPGHAASGTGPGRRRRNQWAAGRGGDWWHDQFHAAPLAVVPAAYSLLENRRQAQ